MDLRFMKSPTKPDPVAAALKMFALLEALAEEETVSLGDIARRSMTSKSTAYRLLQTMQELGYIERREDGEKYALTLKLYTLGAKVLARQADLIKVADRAMGVLSRKTQEAVNLGVLDAQTASVVYVHKFNSQYNLCMQSPIGKRNPLYSTSLGKVLLAWSESDERAALLPRLSYEKLAPNTITDAAVFAAQLEIIRRQGYAEEVEESEAGVRCLGAPIFDHAGRITAAVSLSFPAFRFEDARHDEYVAMLCGAGRQISEGLGFTGSHPFAS
jgi:IclR family KDG regulon transcriptional repressor